MEDVKVTESTNKVLEMSAEEERKECLQKNLVNVARIERLLAKTDTGLKLRQPRFGENPSSCQKVMEQMDLHAQVGSKFNKAFNLVIH